MNVLQIGSSQVSLGNLLTLPVGGGLLYVQPAFVQSTGGGTSYPLLRKVLVAFGDQLAFEDTLAEALDTLFDGDSGADTGDEDVVPIDPDTGEPVDPNAETPSDPDEQPGTDEGSTPSQPAPPSNDTQEQALADAQEALAAKQQALEDGDMVAYAEADADLTDAIERLLAFEEE
jgi:uncharacterized membrane protein (UPF0182 family)